MKARRPMARVSSTVALVALALAVAGCAGGTPAWTAAPTPSTVTVPIPSGDFGLGASPAPLGQRNTKVDPPVPAAPLALPDTSGHEFDLASLRGAPVLVYFGYTHCPDLCPATLGVLREVVKARPDVHVVFVTVDPARDTSAVLAEYLGYFHEGWIGLSGSDAATKAAADGYGVAFAKVEDGSAAGYSMAHTAQVDLIDASGLLRYAYPFGVQADEILRDLNGLGT